MTVVHVPDGLVIPDLAGQQNSTESDPLPGAGGDVHLGVGEQPLQVDQGDDGALGRQLRRVEQRPDELVDLAVVRVVLIIVTRYRVSLKMKVNMNMNEGKIIVMNRLQTSRNARQNF